MTYLIEGANEHTDSLGNIGQIGPGGAQWMKSGRGILHTERNLVDRASIMHGLQIWARLPVEQQDDEPEYKAFQAEDMTCWMRDGAQIKLIAGDFEGHRGPLPLAIPSVMAHVSMDGKSHTDFHLGSSDREYALYVIGSEGGVWVDDDTLVSPGAMLRVASGRTRLRLTNKSPAPLDLFLIGGAPAPRPLVFGGSYVLDSEAAIQAADQRYRLGEMGTLDGVPF